MEKNRWEIPVKTFFCVFNTVQSDYLLVTNHYIELKYRMSALIFFNQIEKTLNFDREPVV